MTLADALREWQNFYAVVGGASAALIGLMFVAVSLGSHLITPEQEQGIQTYVNPTLIHFVIVFVVACTVLVPDHSSLSLAIVVGVASAVGLRQAIHVGQYMRQRPAEEIAEDNHWLWHLILPLLSYGVGCAFALGLAFTGQVIWLNGFALMVMLLIVCAIHNVWILVLWIARH